MGVTERTVTVQFAKEDRHFYFTVRKDNEKTVSFRLDGNDTRHLFNAIDKAINQRPRSDADFADLERQYLEEKSRREASKPVAQSPLSESHPVQDPSAEAPVEAPVEPPVTGQREVVVEEPAPQEPEVEADDSDEENTEHA